MGYHQQPYTLDPTKEPLEELENVPLAISHDEDERENVEEAHVELREQVKAEQDARDQAAEAGDPEPGAPREAGDHAGSDEGSDQTTQSQADDEVPQGTIADVQDWVGDDPDRAQQALDAERAGQNRATLVAWLEDKGAS
jgi:hypothetical protein